MIYVGGIFLTNTFVLMVTLLSLSLGSVSVISRGHKEGELVVGAGAKAETMCVARFVVLGANEETSTTLKVPPAEAKSVLTPIPALEG